MRSSLFFNPETIQSEYRRIDSSWLRIEYRLLLWLAASTPVMEFLFYLLMRYRINGELPDSFLLKYPLFPLLYDGLIALIATFAMKSRLSEKWKIYIVSLLLTALVFGAYTIHAVLSSLFAIFMIPMALTVIYGNRWLTTLISVIAILSKAASDVFLYQISSRPSVCSSVDEFTDFSVSLLLLVLFYLICWLLLKTEQAKNNVSLNLERERQQYQIEALTDPLTKVGNRLALRTAFRFMEKHRLDSFHLAMLDLDAFKLLNDTFGHNCGDQYLQTLGSTLLELSGQQIQPFRFGGDEFCLLFHGYSQPEVYKVCQELQNRFSRTEIHQQCQPVSISIGVTQLLPLETSAALLERADKALYQAKLIKGDIMFL